MTAQVKYDGSWSRTYAAALILVDCNGNFKYKLFHEVSTMSKTRPLSRSMWLRLQLGKDPALLLGATVGATIELGGTVHAVEWLRGGMKHPPPLIFGARQGSSRACW